LKDAQFKYPPQMLEDETNAMFNQLERRLSEQNLDMATYLKTRRMEEADLRKELTPAAEARIKRSLVLFEIARAENIQVDPNEIQNETIRTLDSITRFYSPKETRKIVTEPFVDNMIRSIGADLTVMHTLERLQLIAKGEFTQPVESAHGEETKPKRTKKTSAKKPSQVTAAPGAHPEETAPADSSSKTEETSSGSPEVTAKPKRAKKAKPSETNTGNME
jgi:trigger factor